MDRFVIRDYDAPAVALGIRWLVSYTREHGLASATIYTHSRATVENLGEAIGDTQASLLYRRHRATIGGVTVESATRRAMPPIGAPVLAVWVSDAELIDRLDRLNIPAICALPWGDELSNWLALRQPIDVASGKSTEVPRATISNPVALRAFESVTATSNLANGFDSRSRARLGHTLAILHDGGEALEPSEIEAWATQNGWGASNGREIGDLASAIIQGRQLRLGPVPFRQDILELWRHSEPEDSGG